MHDSARTPAPATTTGGPRRPVRRLSDTAPASDPANQPQPQQLRPVEQVVEPVVEQPVEVPDDGQAPGPDPYAGVPSPAELAEQHDDQHDGHGPPEASRGVRTPVLGVAAVCLADVTPERVSWLWEGRLPTGKLVVLDGDPGVGKSTLALTLAAHVSTGRPWPDRSPCPVGSVVVLSAEDGLADTIAPRLRAAGAEATRVHAMTGITVTDPGTGEVHERPVTLADTDRIAELVRTVGARLLVVDVLMAYLPSGTDSHKDQDVRRVLHRLTTMGEDTGCCVLLLRHLNKAAGTSALYRGGGSIGIVGAARAGFLAARDPEDDGRVILASTKSNLAPAPASLAYRLVSTELGCARVEWDGEVELSAHDLTRPVRDDDDSDEGDALAVFIRQQVEDAGGAARAADVTKAVRTEFGAVPKMTLARARKRAGVATGKQAGTMRGGWWWYLPEHAPPGGAAEGTAEGTEGPGAQSGETFGTFLGPS